MTDTPVTRVLIAGRGEIARRVLHTCRRLGLGTVAVYSDPDAGAPFVREADLAVRLPGASATETYLRGDLIIEAALRAEADAVHPGYGFLSENAGFAGAVIDAGLTWIGPAPQAIAAMGSKMEAKRRVAAAGVPTLAELDPAAVTVADLPVLVKASAGGGGRGMRVVHGLADLAPALEAARAEARSAFGDPAVFVEPYLESGHHVEVQVMADRHGTIWALGERECSIQRRHQKVIEEAPSPLVVRLPGMRERLVAAAVAAARSVGYEGAGTVEFLAGTDGRFFFLEMNTRLQVEHPVTECTTGLDLVELQLLVAAGGRLETLPPPARGAAIEARLYAEDPAANWHPASGAVHRFELAGPPAAFTPPLLPAQSRGVRLDAAVESGSTVTVHYDPMLAKVIAWAPTRDEAARILSRALARARVHGPRTDRDLLVRVLRHPAFLAGDTDTGFLARHGPALTAPLVEPAQERLAAIAAVLTGAARRRAGGGVLAGLPSGWRNLPSGPQRDALRGPAGEHEVSYRFTRGGLQVDGASGMSLLRLAPDEVTLEVDGLTRSWHVARYDDGTVAVDGDAGGVTFEEVERFGSPRDEVIPGSLVAQLPGTVTAVHVAVGDLVGAGQPLLVLEAMKMQHPIGAPSPGIVTDLPVRTGQSVQVGAVLAVVTTTDDPAPQPPTTQEAP